MDRWVRQWVKIIVINQVPPSWVYVYTEDINSILFL